MLLFEARLTGALAAAEYWAGINQDGHARNASGVTLDGDLRVRWE